MLVSTQHAQNKECHLNSSAQHIICHLMRMSYVLRSLNSYIVSLCHTQQYFTRLRTRYCIFHVISIEMLSCTLKHKIIWIGKYLIWKTKLIPSSLTCDTWPVYFFFVCFYLFSKQYMFGRTQKFELLLYFFYVLCNLYYVTVTIFPSN